MVLSQGFLMICLYRLSRDEVVWYSVSLGAHRTVLDCDLKKHRVTLAYCCKTNTYFDRMRCVQVMGAMSVHEADRSSDRASGGPHRGFPGLKVTPIFPFAAQCSYSRHHTFHTNTTVYASYYTVHTYCRWQPHLFFFLNTITTNWPL